MKSIIIYKSVYGCARQYAEWIAEDLQCKAEAIDGIIPGGLTAYDTVVYVGGVYAGGINGVKKFLKHLDGLKGKKVVVCMVGATRPSTREIYDKIFTDSIPENYRGMVKPFALHGDQLHSKMNFLHKLMMNMPKSMIKKIPEGQRTEEQKLFLENFGKDVMNMNRDGLTEVLAYIKG